MNDNINDILATKRAWKDKVLGDDTAKNIRQVRQDLKALKYINNARRQRYKLIWDMLEWSFVIILILLSIWSVYEISILSVYCFTGK